MAEDDRSLTLDDRYIRKDGEGRRIGVDILIQEEKRLISVAIACL